MKDKPYTEIHRMLRGIALFADLPPGQIDMLARGACVRQLARGLIIYRSGETASEVHCVLSGHVKRTTEPQGNDDTVLDLIYPGQMFGETELIAGRPRISFAIAAETTRLLCIGSKTFSELLQSTPSYPRAFWLVWRDASWKWKATPWPHVRWTAISGCSITCCSKVAGFPQGIRRHSSICPAQNGSLPRVSG